MRSSSEQFHKFFCAAVERASGRGRPLVDKIKKAIKWDIRISRSDLHFEVLNGVVTISGIVDREFRLNALRDVAAGVTGEEEVNILVKVDPSLIRTDRELEKLIQRRLGHLSFQEGDWINVSVADGAVRLIGRTRDVALKAEAAKCAWGLSGVKDCVNLIEIGGKYPGESIAGPSFVPIEHGGLRQNDGMLSGFTV